MVISLKHSFQSAKADGPDSTLVQPSSWNAEHALTMATARIIGRTTAGTGAAEEISVGSNLSLASTTLNLASSVSIAALTLSGALTAGDATFNATTSIKVPVGTTAQRPTPAQGQFRFNSSLSQFEGYDGTKWGTVGGGATGGGTDQVFYENGQTVTTNYTITASRNAMSAGPITISSGVMVTIPSGARWVIV